MLMAMVWEKRRVWDNSFLIISLVLHITAVAVLGGHKMGQYLEERGSAISVEWVKNVPEPKLERAEPKQPILMKFDPNRDPDLKGRKKLSKASPSKIAWVKKKSDRLVERSVEINDGPKRDSLPDIMTAAQIRDSLSSISGLVSTEEGPIDGRGIVGNQVRARGSGQGDRNGLSVLGIDGDGSGLGTGGGGGGSGILDRLGIISFMNESDGPQKIIYCLDVSASMAAGAKLPVSIKSLKESLMQLSDFDNFNIVAFYSTVRSFQKQSVPATMENIEKASRFLDSFTPRNIENNLGTDILEALKYALGMNPSVIVLVTDIQPTRGEVDEERIAEEIKRINKSARIYGIGVEVWEPKPDGRLAKLLKILTEQNGGQMKLAGSG
jgi:hypothetical protein